MHVLVAYCLHLNLKSWSWNLESCSWSWNPESFGLGLEARDLGLGYSSLDYITNLKWPTVCRVDAKLRSVTL